MIKAIHKNVILKSNKNTKTNGIYMPNSGSDSYIVLHVGPEVSTVKVGEIVVLDKLPKLFKDGMDEYYITNIENVIAVVGE